MKNETKLFSKIIALLKFVLLNVWTNFRLRKELVEEKHSGHDPQSGGASEQFPPKCSKIWLVLRWNNKLAAPQKYELVATLLHANSTQSQNVNGIDI